MKRKNKEQIAALELAVKQLKGELTKTKRAAQRNANISADLIIERDRAWDALRLAREAAKDDGWERIAERQRVYIRALEERLAGTWNPADTHQQEYDAMYAARRARN